MRWIEIVLVSVVLFLCLSSFGSFLPALKLFIFDKDAKLHALSQAPKATPVFDNDYGFAIGTITEVNFVLLLQVCIFEAFKDAVPFALEPLCRLLVQVFDSLGAVRVVSLDSVAVELRGKL